MPAAAVIPAPIAYIKVAAVKKLVVGSESRPWRSAHRGVHRPRPAAAPTSPSVVLTGRRREERRFHFEKIRVLRAGPRGPDNGAWNDGIGPRFYLRRSLESEVMIERNGRGHPYCDARGEILGPSQDEPQRKRLPRTLPLIKNESQRFEGDQIPP